jgi:hypothetical protein
MKWPWVSRATYDISVALNTQAHGFLRARDQEISGLLAERHAAEQRYSDLLAKYHELAMPKTPAVPAAVVIEHEPPDAVTKVIREQAGRDPKLLAHFRKYARDLKAQGKTEDQIIGALVAWQTSELSEGL